MQQYELLFILPGTLAETEIAPIVKSVEEIVTQSGAAEVTISDLGKSRLAYPMKHIRYGYFQLCYFVADPGRVPGLQDKLRLMPQLLRAVIQKIDPTKKATNTKIDIITDVRDRTGMETVRAPGSSGVASRDSRMPVTALTHEPAVVKAVVTETKAEDIRLEDIDKKLDEILDSDIANV